jgi:hypothetical protein
MLNLRKSNNLLNYTKIMAQVYNEHPKEYRGLGVL